MRIAFTTLGCRLNQFETEAMGRRAQLSASATLVDWGEDAEIYVINSCTVTARAEQKCRQLARGVKRKRPESKVLVVGCYAQLNGRPLMELPEIDGVLGNEEKKRLDLYLERLAAGEGLLETAPFRKGMRAHRDEWIDEFAGHSRATVKVQEGCNMRCRFCAIWTARGPSRSRPPRDVVEQAQRLAAAGYEEIVLGGVHLGHYGRDLDPRTSLVQLLEMLLELVDEGVRFRLSSIDPSEVDRPLLELLAQKPRLCRYLHLPLQSGSNRILREMRRAYGAAYYRQLVEDVAALDPDFGLGVDVIVGYPGESEADFAATEGLLESLPISFYHVFPYSDRPGTPASTAPGKVPGGVIQARAKRLRELGARRRSAFFRRHIGRSFEGVVEGESPESSPGRRIIMLDTYATVVAPADASLERKRVRVHIDGIDDQGRLQGHLCQVRLRPAEGMSA